MEHSTISYEQMKNHIISINSKGKEAFVRDGFELDILKGARKLLSSLSLIDIIIEFEFENEIQLKDMIQILKNNHFDLVKKSDWVDYSINGHEIRNFIFKK